MKSPDPFSGLDPKNQKKEIDIDVFNKKAPAAQS